MNQTNINFILVKFTESVVKFLVQVNRLHLTLIFITEITVKMY